jgi:hypothetical protein
VEEGIRAETKDMPTTLSWVTSKQIFLALPTQVETQGNSTGLCKKPLCKWLGDYCRDKRASHPAWERHLFYFVLVPRQFSLQGPHSQS